MLTKREGVTAPPRMTLPDDEDTRLAVARFRAAVKNQLIKRGVPAIEIEERVEEIMTRDSALRLDIDAIWHDKD
jgi:hypothetical protein